MSTIPSTRFIKTLPEVVIPILPAELQIIQVRQPFRWLVQFHFGEPRLHYEVAHFRRYGGWELGFHCEARDKRLNRFLLDGFRRNLFEIKDSIGERVEAEMWDRGWTKIYEVVRDEPLTADYQRQIGERLAGFITCLHPIFVELRSAVAKVYR